MNNLKKLRKSKGLTQQELAQEMETTKLTISNWENEKHTIKAEKAKQLADFLVSRQVICWGLAMRKKVLSFTPQRKKECGMSSTICSYPEQI